MFRTKDRVELRQSEMFQRVLTMNKHLLRVVEIANVETTRHDLDGSWRISLEPFESSRSRSEDFLAQDGNVSHIGEQGRYLFPALTTAIVVMIGACYGVGRRYAPLLGTFMVTAMMLFCAGTQLFEFRGYFT